LLLLHLGTAWMGGGCIGVGLGFGKISGLEREVSCGITGDL